MLQWAAANGIVLHRGLDYFASSSSIVGGRGVQAKEDIGEEELLCLIPFEVCLGHELWLEGPKDSPDDVPAAIAEHFGRQSLGCAALLLHEASKGRRSRYFPYIESLPKQFCNSLFFSDQALALLHQIGSGLRGLRRGQHVVGQSCWSNPETWCSASDAKAHFERSVLPRLLQRPDLWPDRCFQSFRWAVAVVLSRGAACSGRGPFLVPFMDAFNHAPPGQNSARLEGDPLSELAFVMRSVRRVGVGGEVFNTYGPLPSAALLAAFGFVPPQPQPADAYLLRALAKEVPSPGAARFLKDLAIALAFGEGTSTALLASASAWSLRHALSAVRRALARRRWPAAPERKRGEEKEEDEEQIVIVGLALGLLRNERRLLLAVRSSLTKELKARANTPTTTRIRTKPKRMATRATTTATTTTVTTTRNERLS